MLMLNVEFDVHPEKCLFLGVSAIYSALQIMFCNFWVFGEIHFVKP